MAHTYRGYSSYQFLQNNSFKLYDVELVEMDLLNHIFTSKGERVMMSDFGTRIPDMLLELLTEELILDLQEELTNVFNYDPRVEMIDLSITPDYDANTVTVQVLLDYIELNVTSPLDLHLVFNA